MTVTLPGDDGPVNVNDDGETVTFGGVAVGFGVGEGVGVGVGVGVGGVGEAVWLGVEGSLGRTVGVVELPPPPPHAASDTPATSATEKNRSCNVMCRAHSGAGSAVLVGSKENGRRYNSASNVMRPEEMVLRLALAALVGSIVGLERERVESAAGLRTHALVCVGAALFMLVSMFGFGDAIRPPAVILDPSRVAAQVVTGIGFLGAGVIIFRRSIIRGLTTAASIWVVAAIGMAIGGGLYLGAVTAAALALGILAVMKPVEQRLAAARRPAVLEMTFDRNRTSPAQMLEWLRADSGLSPQRVDTRANKEPTKTRVELTFAPRDSARVLSVVPRIVDLPGVLEAKSSG